jgi:hypothetical protein
MFVKEQANQDGVHKVWYQNALAIIAPQARTLVTQGADILWYNAENQHT